MAKAVKHNRSELLLLLMERELEIKRLEEKLAFYHDLNLAQAGTLADSAIAASGILEAAQRAADIYLAELERRSGDALGPDTARISDMIYNEVIARLRDNDGEIEELRDIIDRYIAEEAEQESGEFENKE